MRDLENAFEQGSPEQAATERQQRKQQSAPEASALRGSALQVALGDGFDAIASLGSAAREVVPVGLEWILGQPVSISACTAALTRFDLVSAEFGTIDHLDFEVRIALSDTEAQLAELLVPLASAGLLFGVDTSPAHIGAPAFPITQAGLVSQRMREFLDLLSLTLFTDGLTGTELTMSQLRWGQIKSTSRKLQDSPRGPAVARLDLVVVFDSGEARATLVLPVPLMARMAAALAAPAASISDRPAPSMVTPVQSPPSRFDGGPPVPAWVVPREDTQIDRTHVAPSRHIDGASGPPRPILPEEPIGMTVELGRTSLMADEILELGLGSVLQLGKLAGEPADILLSGRLVARGEVVVIDNSLGVRITEITSPQQRANAMGD